MSIDEFERGYWYVGQLKSFARELGLRATSKLRKDQLEKAIEHYLTTGKIEHVKEHKPNSKARDSELGLSLDLEIVNYTNNKETKSFLLEQAKVMNPEFRLRSGTRYPLNRWREEQMTAGRAITYGDLVAKFVELNQGERTPLRTKVGRYNNFVADYLADQPGTPLSQVIEAWEELKNLELPKTYKDWLNNQSLS